jgi:hypothetical protein
MTTTMKMMIVIVIMVMIMGFRVSFQTPSTTAIIRVADARVPQ